VQDSERENAQRWLAWRAACESGRDRAEAYDVYLHPATRIALDRLDPDPVSGDGARQKATSSGW
jgi:hypothetical protein